MNVFMHILDRVELLVSLKRPNVDEDLKGSPSSPERKYLGAFRPAWHLQNEHLGWRPLLVGMEAIASRLAVPRSILWSKTKRLGSRAFRELKHVKT